MAFAPAESALPVCKALPPGPATKPATEGPDSLGGKLALRGRGSHFTWMRRFHGWRCPLDVIFGRV